MRPGILIVLFMLAAGSLRLWGQVKDSTILTGDSLALQPDSAARAKQLRKKLYSTSRKATVLSAVLPGLGQVYNGKYWKVPIIYAGLGAFGYMFVTNNNEFKYYRKNLIAAYDDDPSTINTSGYSGDQLQQLKLQFRRYRDIGIIGMGLLYIFNIIDANVDGHLKTFDVSDDLSIHIDPWHSAYRRGTMGCTSGSGLSIKINFN